MEGKLDVLLIAAPSPSPLSVLSNRISSYPPLGLCYIGSYLNQKHYTVKILDLQLESTNISTVTDVIKRERPTIVGISSTTESYQCGLRIARICKECDDSIIIVMGGAHVTFEYNDALANSFVDIVSLREGELTLKELCDYYIEKKGKLSDVAGIAYCDDKKIIKTKNRAFISDLDMLPIPDRSLIKLREYATPGTISSSRGCPGRCIFCAAGALGGGKYRYRSTESVLEEMDYLSSLGVNYFHFVDDTITADQKRFEALVTALIKKKKQNKEFRWACESRVDIVTRDLLVALRESGCISVQFGVESGSQDMLDSMRKGITLQQIRKAFGLAAEIGVETSCCFIIGNPDDTYKTTKDSISFAEELSKLGAYIVYSISTPYPGTYMYNHADELGLDIFDFNWDHYTTYTSVMNTRHLTSHDIQTLFFDASTSKTINRSESQKQRTEYIRKRFFGKK